MSSNERQVTAMLNIATESWRFSKLFTRLVTKLDAGEQNRFVSQYRYFIKKMEEELAEVGYSMVNLEGQIYDPGMAVTPLNSEDFGSNDRLYIEQMLEPIIMGNDGIVKAGTVLLRKAETL